MTALLEKVLAQVSQVPDTKQDALAERIQQALAELQLDHVTSDAEEQNTDAPPTQPKRRAGTATGEFWMSEDFNAPLESFLESKEGKQALAAKRPPARYGSAKGLGYMTADFEEPLEEFKEYTG